MAHRRVKDVSLTEDDVGDYDELDEYEDGTNAQNTGADDELTAEEEEQLRMGTGMVRSQLTDIEDKIEDSEIREALWYYYYDIQKTVDWLKRQHTTPEATKKSKQKTPSKFDQAAAAAEKKATPRARAQRCPNYLTASAFFADTPFLAVPTSRLGVLVPLFDHSQPSHQLKGGLLGGSGTGSKKPSKLAALAASRKKAAEEKKQAISASPSKEDDRSRPEGSGETSKAEPTQQQQGSVALLEKLGRRQPSATLDGQKASDQRSSSKNMSQRAYPRREKASQDTLPSDAAAETEETSKPPSGEVPEEAEINANRSLENLQADPSVFAQGLFAPSRITEPPFQTARDNDDTRLAGDLFTLPYPLPRDDLTTAVQGKSKDAVSDPFAGPSPDDIVSQAQSKGAKQNAKTPSKKPASSASMEQKTADTTEGVEAMKLESRRGSPTSRIKSKNLDVVAEFEKSNMKNSANFVVIGHVDHGKSTLMGRLLHDLSMIPARAFQKLQASSQQAGKGSFSFAWLLDTTESERSRGITVDVASTTFATDSTDFTILDAPGHKDFVPNMIAGTSQADFAVLVVDATTDAFEKGMEGGGQTKEHALLARALGVNRIIVAVNKMDASHPAWSKDRFDTVSQQMAAFLSSAGFATKNVAFIPCAGLTGDNVVKPLAKAGPNTAWAWYQGPTLLEQLDKTASAAPTTRIEAIHAPLRLVISDVFRGSITSPLSISGRIDTGSLQVGDILLAQPAGETAAIKGIEIASSSSTAASTSTPASEPSPDGSAEWAVAGQIVTLHLTDIDPVHLRSGDVLCSQASPIQTIQKFTAKILAFDFLVPGPLDVLKGRLQTEAQVTRLLELLDKKADADSAGGKPGSKKKPRVVKPGTLARVEVKLEKNLPLEKGNRVVLRSEGVSVAAGVVEGVAGSTSTSTATST